MKKRIRAIRDFVCIRPDQLLETQPGSLIVVPSTAHDDKNPNSGIVVSVGDGLVEGGQIIPLKVKIGQRVYFPRNAGTLFKNHPIVEDTFILRENQIFGYDDEIREDEEPAFKMAEGMGIAEVVSGWEQ